MSLLGLLLGLLVGLILVFAAKLILDKAGVGGEYRGIIMLVVAIVAILIVIYSAGWGFPPGPVVLR